jgi:hypothetical protein
MSDQSKPDETPFFIGWASPPEGLRLFLISFAASALLFAGFAAYVIASTQNDPGNGAFVGRANAIGVMTALPYPILHVTESQQFPDGTALILSGGGKIGVQGRADPLDGQMVRAAGARIARGDLTGLQLRGGRNGLRAEEGTSPITLERASLGTWRMTGEICDGKCLAGAMRPGRGLAHKACANLCLIGGVPPVFVSSGKVDGTEFFLVADENGNPIPESFYDYTAIFIEAEGEIEQLGTLKIFKIREDSIKVIR